MFHITCNKLLNGINNWKTVCLGVVYFMSKQQLTSNSTYKDLKNKKFNVVVFYFPISR